MQLSGVPGSGKSTLARALATEGGFVVLDTDVLKSALIEQGVLLADAGRATYTQVLTLAEDLLAQGHQVIVDSPCRYDALLAAGRSVAGRARVPYALIELWAADPATLLSRLDRREARCSQVASSTHPAPGTGWEFGSGPETLRAWQDQLVRPDVGWLRLDALAPPEDTLDAALTFLRERHPPAT